MLYLKILSTVIASSGIFTLFYALIHDEVMGFLVTSARKKRRPYLTRAIFLAIMGVIGLVLTAVFIWI